MLSSTARKANQQGENQAGHQDQSQRAEADHHDHCHSYGEGQMNHDPVIQRQHTPKESHQQPQDGCLAEMGAEGTEEHLCAALIIRPERCQGGNHGGGGSADGEQGQTAQQPQKIDTHQRHKAAAQAHES